MRPHGKKGSNLERACSTSLRAFGSRTRYIVLQALAIAIVARWLPVRASSISSSSSSSRMTATRTGLVFRVEGARDDPEFVRACGVVKGLEEIYGKDRYRLQPVSVFVKWNDDRGVILVCRSSGQACVYRCRRERLSLCFCRLCIRWSALSYSCFCRWDRRGRLFTREKRHF